MSTPTLARRISSSTSRLRLTLLKKILPPASPLMLEPDYLVAGATYQPGSMRFGTPLFCSVSQYSLRMYGSSIQ